MNTSDRAHTTPVRYWRSADSYEDSDKVLDKHDKCLLEPMGISWHYLPAPDAPVVSAVPERPIVRCSPPTFIEAQQQRAHLQACVITKPTFTLNQLAERAEVVHDVALNWCRRARKRGAVEIIHTDRTKGENTYRWVGEPTTGTTE
jgi:hypothetical protein